MTSKSKKDKIKQGNQKDFDLLYDVLVNGGTYSDYRSELLDRSMPQEQLNFDISEDNILAAWILGKDEESELYAKGGHIHQGLNSNLYRQQFGGTWNNPNFNSGSTTSTTSSPSADSSESIGFGGFDIGSGLSSIATPAGQLVDNTIVNWLDTGNYGDWKTDIQGESIDPLARLASDISGAPTDNAIERLKAERLSNDPNFAIGDTASNLSQYYSYIRDRGPKKQEIQTRDWDARVMDNLNASGQGALQGAKFGPWGALIGGIIGGVANIPSQILEDKNRQKLNNEILKYNIGLDQGLKEFDTNLTNSYKMQLWNQLQQPYLNTYSSGGKMKNRLASGGYINSHYDYITDPLVKVDAGGTHQENPNEGVLTSIAPDGQPNLVEEGETIINNGQDDAYVFSDRIVADDEILKSHLLPNKFAGKTYADISKELDKIIEEHKNDEISKRTFDEMISRLQQAQEDQKFKEKQEEVEKFLDGLTDEQKEQLEQAMVEEAQAEQQAAEEQAIAEQQAQELAVQEQLMQPEQASEQVVMEQPEEQIVPSRYDQMMSRALFADAANQGLFGSGGHVAQLGLKIKNRSFDLYPGRNVLDEVVVTAPRMPEPEYFQVPDVDYGILNQPSRPARHIVITPASTTVPSSGNQVVEEEIVIPQTEYSNRLFYNNPYEGIGNYLDNTYTSIPGNETDSTPATRKPSQRRNYPVKSQPVIMEAKPEYSNPHRPDYSMFGQYIPGLVPEEINGNVIGYRDPFGRFVPIGGYSDYGDTVNSIANEINISNTNTNSSNTNPSKSGSDEDELNPDKSITDWSTYLRYAPAVGSGIQYLSDLFGVTNRNDFHNADLYQRSINAIPNVGFVPLGNYMTYSPLDETYQQNVARSQYNAARRAAINNASGNASAALAAMDSLNGNMNNTFGDLALKAREYNDKQREAVEQFNANIARINSMMSLSTQEKNQAIAAEKARLTYNLANMRENIQNMNDAAKSANENTFYKNLGAIGNENFNMQMVRTNPAFYYTIMSDGSIVYKNGFYDLDEGDRSFVQADAQRAQKEQLLKNQDDAQLRLEQTSQYMRNPMFKNYMDLGFGYSGLTNGRR